MKSIIVSTDFSDEAENALKYSRHLAKNTGAKLVLFNSFVIPLHASNTLLPGALMLELENNNRQLLEEKAVEIGEDLDVLIETGFLEQVEDGLEVLFAKHNADMVVMGMASKSVEQEIFGNTTTSAILKLKYPVLAVPLLTKYEKIDQILFACDDLNKVDVPVLNKIKLLAEELGASLEIFHVEKRRSDSSQEIVLEKEITPFTDIEHRYRSIEADDVIQSIKEEIIRTNAKLLIMIPRQHSFWESLIHRSKTRLMASGLSIPLLSIPQ